MTKVYVDSKLGDQTISCSDHTTGEMSVEPSGKSKEYCFRFYGHMHPSFSLMSSDYHNGEDVTVKTANVVEKFQLDFK
ncbi:hypothetical protein [Limosilactobacillus sp.]|uniref:hypothetical protein n=1 Tax=Limosilactobacillus sp. TaxID=2773925 RepID=UPI00345E4913